MKILCLTLTSWLLDSANGMPGGLLRINEPVLQPMSPCARISSSASVALQTAPKVSPTVHAQLAYECLTSVPINKSDATKLVESIFPYVEWQSDLSYLKNPPPGYLMPAVDIKAELNRILSSIKDGDYANEHEFQMELFQVFQSAHDGHFKFTPDLLGKALNFRRPVGLVSVSKDGFETPRIYIDSDIQDYVSTSSLIMPSAVTDINGQNAMTFIENLMTRVNQHDPDAQFNIMMYSKAFDARFPRAGYRGLFALASRLSYFYPGPNTTIRFENMTERIYQNYASVIAKFDDVVDGPSMYQKFCTDSTKTLSPNKPTPTPEPESNKSTHLKDRKPVNGYPNPHIISSDQVISGYFLDNPNHQDVAVLVIFSFNTQSIPEFQSVIQNFIADSVSKGKNKMIIDLSSNGGGNLLCAYDTFRQFFPQTNPTGFTRFRLHDALKIITKQISWRASNFSLNTTNPMDFNYYQTPFNYRFDVNETNGPFLSYEDKFTTRVFNGDEYTSYMRWNLEDPTMTMGVHPLWSRKTNITGFGDRKNFTQPFNSEDIVLLYDGVCASTCSIFSEFMREESGVRSVAIGGRPNTAPIQGIGGTRGANSYSFNSIHRVANQALNTGTPEQIEKWTSLTALTDLPIKRSIDNAINVRDNILRSNLEDGIPTQFLYEPADCRLFFEPKMIADVGSIWNKVASAVWGDSKCVAGTMKKHLRTRNDREKYVNMSKSELNNDKFYIERVEMETTEILQKLISDDIGTEVLF